MKNFEKNYDNFNRRKPKSRFGNKWDTTHIRIIDEATKEEILAEYDLIKQKKSDLPSTERQLIIEMVEK